MEERVLHDIRQQKLAMRSKWRLGLPHVLVVAGAIILALAVILHTNSILYGFRMNGSWLLLQSGFGNLHYVLSAFPWLLTGLAVVLVLGLVAIISRTTRAYRLPILYTIITVPAVVVALSVLMETFPGNDELHKFTTQSIPMAGAIYRSVANVEPAHTFIGEVRAATADHFTLINRQGVAIPVQVSVTTKLPTPSPVQDSQVVQVIGKKNQGKVEAESIQKVPAHFQEDVLERIRNIEQQQAREKQTEQPEAKTNLKNTNNNGE